MIWMQDTRNGRRRTGKSRDVFNARVTMRLT